MGIDRLEDLENASDSAGRTSRRKVLLGAGAIGAAGAAAALAACGSSGSDSAGDGGSTGGSAPAGGASSGSGGGSGDSNLAKTSDIPVGGGKIFADKQVVVTQPTAGQYKAFSAICTHQGCTVNQIANGLIMCPCHGSEYSITDGAVKRAAEAGQKPLPAKKVTVAGGEISVS